jgi:hypothetical protein
MSSASWNWSSSASVLARSKRHQRLSRWPGNRLKHSFQRASATFHSCRCIAMRARPRMPSGSSGYLDEIAKNASAAALTLPSRCSTRARSTSQIGFGVALDRKHRSQQSKASTQADCRIAVLACSASESERLLPSRGFIALACSGGSAMDAYTKTMEPWIKRRTLPSIIHL